MKIIDEIVTDKRILKYNLLEKYYNADEIVMFDIETTGLSPTSSYTYLIGVNYKDGENWIIRQYFNDDGESEARIIKEFMNFIAKYRYLIHFNGSTFDIPYIEKRIYYLNNRYYENIDNNFPNLQSVDLLRIARGVKKILNLEGLRQKQIEEFLGLNRIDKYNGGELIYVYFDYLRNESEELRGLLLQHNRDDMEGMYLLSSLLSFTDLDKKIDEITDVHCERKNDDEIWLICTMKLSISVPFELNDIYFACKKETASSLIHEILMDFSNDEVKLRFLITRDNMKLFFDEYKNYYYYPELDCSYSKDVSVPKQYCRETAKKSNCYTNIEGVFIRTLDGAFSGKEFLRCYNDKKKYILLNDEFLANKNLVFDFMKNIVKSMIENGSRKYV